jgi:FkbM family methyltransferase
VKNYSYHQHTSLKTKFLNLFRKFFIDGYPEKFLLKRIEAAEAKGFWLKVIPPDYLYPTSSWRYCERNGIQLKLNISNVVDHLKYFLFKDVGFENFLQGVQPHFTVLDIGANIGMTALEFAKKVQNGKVVCFEPSPSNFAQLSENISINSFKNIIASNTGIGTVAGQFKLFNVVDNNPGMKRILTDAESQDFESETIVVDTLESQLEKLNTAEVHAIKIDVEGFEMEVLKSATAILRKYKPILFIELDDNNLKDQKSSALLLIKYLIGLDYKIYNAMDNSQQMCINNDYSNCHFDIICQ